MSVPVPRFEKAEAKTSLRVGLLLTALLTALALAQFRAQIVAEGLFFTSLNFRAALYGGYFALGLLVFLTALAWTSYWDQVAKRLRQVQALAGRLGNAGFFLLVGMLALYLMLVMGFYGRFLLNAFPRLALFWFSGLAGTTLLAAWRKRPWVDALPIALILIAVVHSAASFFQQVSAYPFSIGWSEISRYYQASFYFAQRIYGADLALPVTHPSRYLLQSLPFLLGKLPLWAHRLWQALLWVGMATAAAALLARRLRIAKQGMFIAFIAWAYLYLMQGAVFYHLLPSVLIVLWGFERGRFRRSLLVVALASAWAGISRINWVPLPGALAALLYIIETPLEDSKKPLSPSYWGPATAYFLGGSLTALGSYWLYIFSSGNEDIGQFASPFTSALLWERLWPNAAFPPGILPGILLVSVPLFIVLWLRLQKGASGVAWLRLAAVFLILAVFFFGGLVVSVKIGGGTNLHNMDAYMVLLLVVSGHFAFGRFAPDERGEGLGRLSLSPILIAFLLLVPVLFSVLQGGPLNLPDRAQAEEALEQIQKKVDETLEAGMQVLFISQRHLITFQMVDAPLVHDYEKLFLMEMAISHNDPYLRRFAEDMDNWRFGLIVSDPLHRNIKDLNEDSLAAENNEWVRFVARPILCAYRPLLTFEEFSVQLLEPRFGSKCNQ